METEDMKQLPENEHVTDVQTKQPLADSRECIKWLLIKRMKNTEHTADLQTKLL